MSSESVPAVRRPLPMRLATVRVSEGPTSPSLRLLRARFRDGCVAVGLELGEYRHLMGFQAHILTSCTCKSSVLSVLDAIRIIGLKLTMEVRHLGSLSTSREVACKVEVAAVARHHDASRPALNDSRSAQRSSAALQRAMATIAGNSNTGGYYVDNYFPYTQLRTAAGALASEEPGCF